MVPVASLYRLGAVLARWLPSVVVGALVAIGARVAVRVSPARALMAQRNLARARGRHPDTGAPHVEVVGLFATYGRYWAESFRLPSLSADTIDAGMDVSGYAHVARSLAAGRGTILVMPHLGGWEWAAFWLTGTLGLRVTAVVEKLEPPELRDFFLELRQSLGVEVIVLGPDAGTAVNAALRRGDVVCLLADRDIEGNGIPVEFFGEGTTLPGGPAVLALRSGATLLPAAVYFDGARHHAVVRPPVPIERRDGFRADVARITQTVACELEELVRVAPQQWHLLQPNWPSDHEALAAAGLGPVDEAAATHH